MEGVDKGIASSHLEPWSRREMPLSPLVWDWGEHWLCWRQPEALHQSLSGLKILQNHSHFIRVASKERGEIEEGESDSIEAFYFNFPFKWLPVLMVFCIYWIQTDLESNILSDQNKLAG